MKIVLFSLFLFTVFLFGQNKAILKSSGAIKYNHEIEQVDAKISLHNFKTAKPYDNVLGIGLPLDTLRFLPNGDLSWNTNFGFFGQDIVVQWFKTPWDLELKGISFNVSDTIGKQVSVKIVDVKWTEEEIEALGVEHIGMYEGDYAFPDDPGNNGFWLGENDFDEPFGSDLWSNEGFGFLVDLSEERRYWMDIDEEIILPNKSLIAVAVKNESSNPDEDRLGLYATDDSPYKGFKFYKNGRFSGGPGEPDPESMGWWKREYTFDIELEVLFTDIGCPVFIYDYTTLTTSLSTEPRPVNIIVDYCVGDTVVAELLYKFDDETAWSVIPMIETEFGHFEAELLSFDACKQSIQYYYRVASSSGSSTQTPILSYFVFCPPYASTLLVFNGYDNPTGFPQSYYFGYDCAGQGCGEFEHDVWSFGALTKELVDHYRNIIEITTMGVNDDNQPVIAEWLAADGRRNYMVAGDEYLGSYSGWPGVPVEYGPETFFYDVLGIEVEHSDIVGNSADVSTLWPLEGSILGDALYQTTKELDIDTVFYDPNGQIGVVNWLDGVQITDDSESFMLADSGDTVLSTGHSRTLPAGNKIAFFGYDPLSIYGKPNHWLGFDESSPQREVLNWFGIVTDIDDQENKQSPEKFTLSQNYPNPFNNTTMINYQLSMSSKVKFVVYDGLGRVVENLVNKKQAAGNYRVTFDASGLASGIYYYKLVLADQYEKTKKMLLLK